MPVPISFVLLPEAPGFGNDQRFSVPVYPSDGPFDLTMLPPAVPDLPVVAYDSEKRVSFYICNNSTGRVWVKMTAMGDSVFRTGPRPRLDSNDCKSIIGGRIPEGTRINIKMQEQMADGMADVIVSPEEGTFLPGQFTTGAPDSKEGDTVFFILAKARKWETMRIFVKGSYEQPRTIMGEY